MPTRSQRQAQEEAEQPSRDDGPSSTDTVVNATTVSAKYSAGPKRSATEASARREERQRKRGERACDERSDGRGRQRGSAATLARHHVAVDGGRRSMPVSPGVLSRMLVVDPPYIAPVVDAGEHDERAGRIELECHRQQQRDGQRRADARQHTDRGAERGTGECPREMMAA